MDRTEQERRNGMGMVPSVAACESPRCTFTVTDTPGHPDYRRYLIRAVAQADCALLVIDASEGRVGIRGCFSVNVSASLRLPVVALMLL